MNRDNSILELSSEKILVKSYVLGGFILATLINGGYATVIATSSKAEFTPANIAFTGSFIILSNALLLGDVIKIRVNSKRKLLFLKALKDVLNEYPDAIIRGSRIDFSNNIFRYSQAYVKSTKRKRKSSKEAIDEFGIVSYNGEE